MKKITDFHSCTNEPAPTADDGAVDKAIAELFGRHRSDEQKREVAGFAQQIASAYHAAPAPDVAQRHKWEGNYRFSSGKPNPDPATPPAAAPDEAIRKAMAEIEAIKNECGERTEGLLDTPLLTLDAALTAALTGAEK